MAGSRVVFPLGFNLVSSRPRLAFYWGLPRYEVSVGERQRLTRHRRCDPPSPIHGKLPILSAVVKLPSSSERAHRSSNGLTEDWLPAPHCNLQGGFSPLFSSSRSHLASFQRSVRVTYRGSFPAFCEEATGSVFVCILRSHVLFLYPK